MQLQYGSYYHSPNSVSITSWQRQTVLGQTGWPELLRVNVALKAKLIGANTADLMAQAYVMRSAYSIGGQPLVMYDNNGSITEWYLNSATAVGGVMVTNPVSFGNVQGAEGTTFLYCTVGLQADYLVSAPGVAMQFQESIDFTDCLGGPLQIERVPAVGRPILQNVTEQSFFYATQNGELWQVGPNPNPMPPIWPGLQARQIGAQRTGQMSPKTIRGVPFRYGCRWQYNFISADPFPFAAPNIR